MSPIKRIRVEILKLTQEEFAAQLRRRQSTVSKWETGVWCPSGRSARAIYELCDGRISLEEILGLGTAS